MTTTQTPLWLDCDPGHDDAFAILLAAYHPNLKLLGISTVYGNAPLSNTTVNALSILAAIGKEDISVYPGAKKPFCRKVLHAVDIHGESGLDGTELLPRPTRSPLSHCNALKEMRDALMACHKETAWIVTAGTLTNVALLFATFPEVVEHIKGLSIMGGAIGGNFTSALLGPDFVSESGEKLPRIGNTSPYAEFNILCDPEASQSIFQNSTLAAKTILVPLDLTHQAFVHQQVRDIFLHGPNLEGTPTRMRRMFHELLMFFAGTYADVYGLRDGPPLHDPLAVAVLLADIDDVSSKIRVEDNNGERWDVDIVLHGEQLGRTVVKPAGPNGGVTIPRSIDLPKFWDAIESCLQHADSETRYT